MGKLYQKIAFTMAAVLALACAGRYRQHKLQEDVAGQILRFHVIANSDTKEDQALKLKVRDEIGSYLADKLSDADGLLECERAVSGYLSDIERHAGEVIEREGYDYPVTAMIEDTEFPDKTYGNYTFPRGTYRALRVVIGDGAGQNWWCVMYPNLCFAGSVYEVDEENAKEELCSVLTEDTYEELVAEGKITVKFKYLDALLDLF